MKTNLRVTCMLLALLLVFSLTGAAAFADLYTIPGNATLTVSVNAERDEYVPDHYTDGDGNEIYLEADTVYQDGWEQKVCSVSYVDRNNQEIGAESSLINLVDRNRQIGIRLKPLDGFYITAIILTGGDYATSQKNLLSVAKASLGSATVTLFLSDIEGPDGGDITINGDYVSSWGLGSDCVLYVSCRRISPDDMHSVWYDCGDHYTDVPGGQGNYGTWSHYVSDMPNTMVTEGDGSVWQFDGYKLVFDNGAYQYVEPQDEIWVYTNATLYAQWEDVTDEYGVTETYVEPDQSGGDDFFTPYEPDNVEPDVIIQNTYTPQPVIPATTVQAPSAEKEFDGYPLTMDAGTDVSVITDEQGISYKVILNYDGGRITDVGSVGNHVSSYWINYMDDSPMFSQSELEASGVFRVLDGALTVTEPYYKQDLTVRGASAVVTASAEGQEFYATDFDGGYTVEGLMPGHAVEGENIVSGYGSSSFETVVNGDAIRVVRTDDGQNVTPLYEIHAENGYVTVNAYAPQPTIPSTTVQAPSAEKEFDGYPLTMDAGTDVSVITDEKGIGYKVVINYDGGQITDIGSVSNHVSSYWINNMDDSPLFSQDELEASGVFHVQDGTLTVTEPYYKQDLTVRGASAEVTATAEGQEFHATDFDGGYTVEGLMPGHAVDGENIVSGYGSSSFETIVNGDAIRVVRTDDGKDVTPLYEIHAENGYVTVNPYVHEPFIPTVTVQVNDASKDYDGTELKASAYEVVSGSLDGYRLDVVYNSITEPGTDTAVLDYTLTDEVYGDVFNRAALDNDPDFTFNIGTLEVRQSIPVVTLTAISKEKTFDGTPLTVAEDEVGFMITDGSVGDYYKLSVTCGSITDVGSTPTLSDYSLSDPYGNVIFTKEQLDGSDRFTVNNGTLVVKEQPPEPVEPTPTVPTAILLGVKESKKYDGQPLTKTGSEGYTVTGDLKGYTLFVEYNTITDVGSVPALANYELRNENNEVVFNKQALDDSVTFTVDPGRLTVEEPDAPTVPAAVLIAVSDSKEYDGKPLTKSGEEGYELTGNLGDYKLYVEYNTITEIGSVDTLASYELRDKDGKTVFTKDNLDNSPNFTVKNGKLTVTKPAPTIPKATLNGASETREYNGAALTKTGTEGYTVSGSLGDYELRVTYNTITEPGSVDTLATYALFDRNGNQAFSKEELDASPNFTINNGKLTVNRRTLKIIAISGTLNTKGETITASSLSTPDGSFSYGYRQIGLLEGHKLSGNFVQGSGNQSFKTSINTEEVHILAGNNWDVTQCYDIQTQDGYITINGPTSYDLIVNPRSYTWTYDGTAHSLREYDYSGLVNGDKLVKVNFSSDASITNIGTQSNRITSVEVTNATGGDVDVNKYILISTPGTLAVEQRDLTVTAISGTLTTTGGTIVASTLSTPDGSFKNGYKVENLVPGHSLTGNFVQGSGTSTFTTSIDLNNLRVVDASGNDVTRNYSIRTVNGAITINASNASQQQRSNVSLSVTAKSGTFTYDGNEHKLNEYTSSGLVDGDIIEKVVFKPSSVITNVGTQPNEIQSVVIKSANGGAVDASKYNINYYSGTLTVTKFPLTLTAVSDEKVYDGKALNNKSVKASALANANHKLSADYEVFDSNGNTIKNGPVDPGVYTKKVSNVKITSGSTDVTPNYDVRLIDGTLKITGTSGESSRATTTTAYYGSTFTIRSDAQYSEFRYLLIDGQKVSTDNFTVKEGSTIITLKSSYIQSLKAGSHNYTIVSTSKQVDGSFNVSKAPKTGDGTSMIVWILLLLLAAIAVALGVFFLSRKQKNAKRRSVKKTGRGQETLRYPSGKEYVRKPASTVVPDLDFEPEPVEDDDPTLNLMKDFDLNLDDYRTTQTQAPEAPKAAAPTERTETSGGFAAPDFGSFDKEPEPEEELPDIEVEIVEEEPETEPEELDLDFFKTETPQEEELPPEEPAPEAAPEPPRRRGKHEAPDPTDPFTDSWYQSMGLGKRDKKK